MPRTLAPDDDLPLADRLRKRGVRGVLVQMAENGQLLELRCEMPTCYCPQGRYKFDPWPPDRTSNKRDWAPNADHYPTLKRDGGQLKPWNVRLAHVFCNNTDTGWRLRIRAMLEAEPTMSFEAIAEVLNRRKERFVPPGANKWTTARVREAYRS